MSRMARNKVKNLLLLKQIHTAVSQIKKGNLDKALETLDKAENAARKAKSTDALYYILFTRGGILYSAAKYDDALETYEKALVAGEELLKSDPESADYQHYMGTTLSNTGNLLKKKGENTKASEFYSRAREIYIVLMAQDPKNAVFRSYAGENLNSYAVFLAETDSIEEAGRIQKEAVEIYEKLLEESPENPGYQAELSVALSNLGSCLIQQSPENNDAAKKNLERALEMQQNLLSQQPENERLKGEIELTQKRLESL
jgi:tetratricopeptide (TPR) repeat protein